MAWTGQLYVVQFCNIGGQASRIEFVFCLIGHLRAEILADTILVPLCKDHTGNAMPTGAKMGPLANPAAHACIANIW